MAPRHPRWPRVRPRIKKRNQRQNTALNEATSINTMDSPMVQGLHKDAAATCHLIRGPMRT